MSAEIKNDRAIDWLSFSADGERRLRRDGIIEDSAPVDETEPTSSWLNKAMTLTFPLTLGNCGEFACSMMDSTAQKLSV